MSNEEKILAMLEQLQTEIVEMKKSDEVRYESIGARFVDIQSRFNGVDTRLDSIETKNEDLEIGQKAIRSDISKVNHNLEPKINAVYEGLDGFLRRNEQADRHEKELEEHDHRLFALEQVVNK